MRDDRRFAPVAAGRHMEGVGAGARGGPRVRLTATVTLVPLLTDASGSTAPLAATEGSGHAWAVPWALLVAVVLLCGLVAAGLAFRRARSDH